MNWEEYKKGKLEELEEVFSKGIVSRSSMEDYFANRPLRRKPVEDHACMWCGGMFLTAEERDTHEEHCAD